MVDPSVLARTDDVHSPCSRASCTLGFCIVGCRGRRGEGARRRSSNEPMLLTLTIVLISAAMGPDVTSPGEKCLAKHRRAFIALGPARAVTAVPDRSDVAQSMNATTTRLQGDGRV